MPQFKTVPETKPEQMLKGRLNFWNQMLSKDKPPPNFLLSTYDVKIQLLQVFLPLSGHTMVPLWKTLYFLGKERTTRFHKYLLTGVHWKPSPKRPDFPPLSPTSLSSLSRENVLRENEGRTNILSQGFYYPLYTHLPGTHREPGCHEQIGPGSTVQYWLSKNS